MTKFKLFLYLFFATFFVSCETEFEPDVVTTDLEQYVVEGYIEGGDQPSPPYLILTKSFGFNDEISLDAVNELYVHDAIVTVDNGTIGTTLEEVCLNDLTDEQKELVVEFFGLEIDSIQIDFCVYIDLSFQMMGEIGRTYDLRIDTGDKILTATTTIPSHAPLDSINFVRLPNLGVDSLLELRCFFNDLPNEANFYRYWTAINEEPFLANISSVTDDRFFDGLAFEFPLAKAEPRDAEFDPITFGLFTEGDTATIKWANLDEVHFKFWNTLEFNALNQGPFSNYTRIESNIEGGLGIWGGYSVSYLTGIVEE